MKYDEIDDNLFNEIVESVEGFSANALWSSICSWILGKTVSYKARKHFFLSAMYRLMKEGRLKIAFHNVFWEGTIEEQLQRYSDRWPEDENCLFEADFQLIENSDDGGLYFWAKGCFVWIYEDGFEEWTN